MSPKHQPDPALDRFREGIASLWRDGDLAGHVATVVEPMWAPFRRQEQVWLLVTWADGHRERIEEGYEPWSSVAELRDWHLAWSTPGGDVDFETRWLEGDAKGRAWRQFGIHDDVGSCMGSR